jgi:indolepyruvate ferredoxin oxidoreductase beta subunit
LSERLHWGMEVNTTSVFGFLRVWLLAKLRRWRPKSHRFREEQRSIEAWLGRVVEAARLSADVALEVAECARLIKGYGDTLKRGSANYRLVETRIIGPILAGRMSPARGLDAIASARAAALADPEGEALTRCIAEIEAQGVTSIAAE